MADDEITIKIVEQMDFKYWGGPARIKDVSREELLEEYPIAPSDPLRVIPE